MDDDAAEEPDDDNLAFDPLRIGLAELSNVETTPTEVTVTAGFEPTDVIFEDDSWIDYLLRVQDWLRLPAPLDRAEAAPALLDGLFGGLGDTQGAPTHSSDGDRVQLTPAGIEVLRERVERAIQLKDQFLDHLQETGSLDAASQVWIDLWEEAVDERTPTEPVNATAAVWPINEFAGKAQKGRLNLSPSYQRGDVWPTKDAQTLIESILRGIPLPSVIVLEPNTVGAPYEVVDGKQRLTAILRFIGGHPEALALVDQRDKDFPDHNLKHLFQTDYRKFKQAWKNATGEQLSATQEWKHYFPFKLSNTSPALSNELEAVRGKYFHEVRETVVRVGGKLGEIGELFESSATPYKIPVIEYTEATPRQIHEVFNLYNKQGKHLNAEEIRNALYHEVDLMRALAVAAGDAAAPDPDLADDETAQFLLAVAERAGAIGKHLDECKIGDARYRRTKVLSWLCSIVFLDSFKDGRPQTLSTAQQISAMLDRAATANDALGSRPTVLSGLDVALQAFEALGAVGEAWSDKFKDNNKGVKWQELQLVAALVGLALVAAVLGEDTADRLEDRAEAVRALSDTAQHKEGAWERPSKTQTSVQWRYIARVALDLVDALGIDPQDVDRELRQRFGGSCIKVLQSLRPQAES